MGTTDRNIPNEIFNEGQKIETGKEKNGLTENDRDLSLILIQL